MEKLEQFYDTIRKDMTVTLATAGENSVTMRVVSPVLYEQSILIFTSPESTKYRQLKSNAACCLAAGTFFAEAGATFLGSTMLPENQKLREVYCEKFPGAFDAGIEFGGRDCEFILLKPKRLSGWAYADDMPLGDGVPTVPFELLLG